MFDRFNWFTFDPSLFNEAPDTRWAKGEQLANAWSAWASQARQYQDAFKEGKEAAIFDFARRSHAVLLAPWVLTVLRRWRASGTRSDKQKIRKFINAWV